ncbi:MAG: hypothetical protein KGM16_05940 [Bacteroidota bacterium]|nr:hypothetical protein [Bacteroidota bacterium]
MKIVKVFLLFLLGSLLFSCLKKDARTNNVDSTPLTGTIEKSDTLRVMAYNVLNYGDLCQGSTTSLDGYFRTIIQYTQPDLMSCEKMTAFPPLGGSGGNLADEILANVLNFVNPDKYNYAAPTNASGSGTLSVLFYNQQKLTYVSTEDLLSLVTDFDLYKFYYNDINLSITKDTTFLYAVVCHTKSGSASLERDFQDSTVMASLRSKFEHFPNLIVMGDFNTRGSFEHGYQSLISSKDSNTTISDPPYYPDETLKYPGNWSISPSYVVPFLTTSTRSLPYDPNACGASGGGKGWYDHIFISNWLINGSNYIKYIPHSYQSVGNDGARTGVSINSNVPSVNTSAPAKVLDALYHFSDKYTVMIRFEVKANRNAVSPVDP